MKTSMSRRAVDLDPRTVAVLKAWKRAQVEDRVALDLRPRDDSLVFADPDRTPIHPDSYSQHSTVGYLSSVDYESTTAPNIN